MSDLDMMTRAEVSSELRRYTLPGPHPGRKTKAVNGRRGYLLSVLGWMDRNGTDEFTRADADAILAWQEHP